MVIPEALKNFIEASLADKPIVWDRDKDEGRLQSELNEIWRQHELKDYVADIAHDWFAQEVFDKKIPEHIFEQFCKDVEIDFLESRREEDIVPGSKAELELFYETLKEHTDA